MTNPNDHQAPAPLLMEVQAAKLLNISERTLQAWRLRGTGPAYVKAGRAIRYRQSDLLEWANENVVVPTAPPTRQTVRPAPANYPTR